jgi:hypothetical protein
MQTPIPASLDEIKNFLRNQLEKYAESRRTLPVNSNHGLYQRNLIAGILIALCEHIRKPYVFIDAYAIVSDFFGNDIRAISEHARSIPHQHLKGLVGMRFRPASDDVLYLQATNQAGNLLNQGTKDQSLVVSLGKDEMRLWPIAINDMSRQLRVQKSGLKGIWWKMRYGEFRLPQITANMNWVPKFLMNAYTVRIVGGLITLVLGYLLLKYLGWSR